MAGQHCITPHTTVTSRVLRFLSRTEALTSTLTATSNAHHCISQLLIIIRLLSSCCWPMALSWNGRMSRNALLCTWQPREGTWRVFSSCSPRAQTSTLAICASGLRCTTQRTTGSARCATCCSSGTLTTKNSET